jgi:hypothetical protein
MQKIQRDELTSMQDDIEDFDAKIHSHFKHVYCHDTWADLNPNIYLSDITDTVADVPFQDEAVMSEANDMADAEAYNQYISAQVLLPHGDIYEKATVTQRKRDHDGSLIGHRNQIQY